jgi:NhaA family Na+:H+ antiporter
VDAERDHFLGPNDVELTLVEYGSYVCAHCLPAKKRIAQVHDQLGERLRYAF